MCSYCEHCLLFFLYLILPPHTLQILLTLSSLLPSLSSFPPSSPCYTCITLERCEASRSCFTHPQYMAVATGPVGSVSTGPLFRRKSYEYSITTTHLLTRSVIYATGLYIDPHLELSVPATLQRIIPNLYLTPLYNLCVGIIGLSNHNCYYTAAWGVHFLDHASGCHWSS